MLLGVIACYQVLFFFRTLKSYWLVSAVVREPISKVIFLFFATDFEGPCL